MNKRKKSFKPTRTVHTLKSVREACIALALDKSGIQLDSVLIERDGLANGLSLGNIEVRCFHNGQFFLAGRFNTIIRSIVDALNS